MRAAAVAWCLGAALLTACGGSSQGANPTGPVDTTFGNAANLACEAALGAVAPTPFPSGVNPTGPATTALPAIGAYLNSQPLNHKGSEFLRRLGRPKQGATSWRRFIAAVDDEQQAVARQITAATSSDRAGYLATVGEVAGIARKIDAAGAAAGFTADSYCVQLFG